jgi:hypothetical protein
LQKFQRIKGSVELLLSTFVAQVERKVDALRAVVQGKEAEISELRARLNRALISAPNRPETEADRQTKWPPASRKIPNPLSVLKYLNQLAFYRSIERLLKGNYCRI